MRDDLGTPYERTRPPRRIVSLVPSLTEALVLTDPTVVVGATRFCIEPACLSVPRVRGTKNPDVDAIAALSPDLVVANVEENRAVDVRRLRARGIPVWVTRFDTVDDALRSLDHLLVDALGLAAPPWLDDAVDEWAPPPRLDMTVAVPVWRDPWRWVGTSTYAHDVLRRIGAHSVVTEPRYPALEPADVAARLPHVVLLPDEPYRFCADDGPECFPGVATVPVAGRHLFWYGPGMVGARAALEEALTS